MSGVVRIVVASAVAALLATATPARAQEPAAATMLVTYASEAGVDRATAEGGSLDRADDGATEIATRVAVAELTPAEAAAVASQPGVVGVEADAEVHAAEAPDDTCYVAPLVCAPSAGSWYVDRVGLPEAWELTHGSGSLVAVLDSGVQQPLIGELAGRVVGELDATGGTPACSSGSSLHHGTQVAGTVGANTDNGTAVPGAGWDVQILSVRVFAGPSCGGTTLSRLVTGVTLALQHGARILNMSVTTTNGTALRAVLDDAARAGAVVVAAAGNGVGNPAVGTDDPTLGNGGYPAAYPDVVAVGSSDLDDGRATFSNFGSWVDLYAPGTQLAALNRSGSVVQANGTSFSAPIVAGVVALMRTVRPSLTPAEISSILTSTADTVAAGRLLDAAEAVGVAGCSYSTTVGAAAAPGGPSSIDVVTTTIEGRPCGRSSPGSDGEWVAFDGGVLGTPDLISAGGQQFLIARGTDGGAWLRFRSSSQAPWEPWFSLGGRFTSDLAVASWGPNRLDVFGRGSDAALWHRAFDGSWGPWQSLGGALASEPDVASWGAGRLDVFAVGTDGTMWHRAFGGTAWAPWEPLGGAFRSGPGVASVQDGLVDVAARGGDDRVWLRSWTGAAWTAWTPIGGVAIATTELLHAGGGTLVAVTRGADGRLWSQRRSGGTWLGWVRLP